LRARLDLRALCLAGIGHSAAVTTRLEHNSHGTVCVPHQASGFIDLNQCDQASNISFVATMWVEMECSNASWPLYL
jgi:hypothetical protein